MFENRVTCLDLPLQPSVMLSAEFGRASGALDNDIVESIPDEVDFSIIVCSVTVYFWTLPGGKSRYPIFMP